MRALIQRVTEASVHIGGLRKAVIGDGLLVLLGIGVSDSGTDARWLSHKICHLRIFSDASGVMNRSILETGYELLLVSQFTLHASTHKGNRPSYQAAAKPEQAIPLYEQFIWQLENDLGKPIASGEFGADMQVRLLNDGPVTIWIDSQGRE
jgi:D-tyrosyl-tRNA(Tyr) deacylase